MSYKIISKYIKDISFEIPNTRAYVMLEKEISNYSLNFDIKSNPVKDNIIEVNTVLKVVPNQEVKHKIFSEITCTAVVSIDGNFEDKKELDKILTEINYTALVSIEKNSDDKKEMEKIVLIKIPTEIYSILYDTFVYLFTQSGIKNIQIDKKVDFEKLYNNRKKS